MMVVVPSTGTLYLLVGSIVTLVYPLYASIRAIEGSSCGNVQQWLTYWVLFTIIRMLELLLGEVLDWLLIWPYAKVTVTLWLVLPYFGGAAHVYEHYIRPCYSFSPQELFVWLLFGNEGFITSRSDEFLVAAERYIQENGVDAVAEIISKVLSKDNVHENISLRVSEVKREEPILSGKEVVALPWPQSPEKTQREWTCALCVVTTSSEQDLRKHLEGKRHRTSEELLANNRISKHKGGLDLVMQATDMADLVEDFNQIKENFVRHLKHHINPIAKPLRWCTWEKPKIGWTKLNTDGSKDPKKAGLGGLLRDHLGTPKCAFVSKAPQDGIFQLEIWAIWRGLVLALGQGVSSIWVESDSMSVVKVINKEWSYPQKDGSCLKQVWELLEKFEMYRVSHSWREANRAADHLAKMNLYGMDVVLWPVDFPESLWNIIKDDAEGKIYIRL